MVMKQPTFQD